MFFTLHLIAMQGMFCCCVQSYSDGGVRCDPRGPGSPKRNRGEEDPGETGREAAHQGSPR